MTNNNIPFTLGNQRKKRCVHNAYAPLSKNLSTLWGSVVMAGCLVDFFEDPTVCSAR